MWAASVGYLHLKEAKVSDTQWHSGLVVEVFYRQGKALIEVPTCKAAPPPNASSGAHLLGLAGNLASEPCLRGALFGAILRISVGSDRDTLTHCCGSTS